MTEVAKHTGVDSMYGSWIVTIASIIGIAGTGNDLPSMENAVFRPAIGVHVMNETTIGQIKEDLPELVMAYAANHAIAVTMYPDDPINVIWESNGVLAMDVSLEYEFDDEETADIYIQINRL